MSAHRASQGFKGLTHRVLVHRALYGGDKGGNKQWSSKSLVDLLVGPTTFQSQVLLLQPLGHHWLFDDPASSKEVMWNWGTHLVLVDVWLVTRTTDLLQVQGAELIFGLMNLPLYHDIMYWVTGGT